MAGRARISLAGFHGERGRSRVDPRLSNHGPAAVVRAEAPGAAEAADILEDRGWTVIRWSTDSIEATVKQFPPSSGRCNEHRRGRLPTVSMTYAAGSLVRARGRGGWCSPGRSPTSCCCSRLVGARKTSPACTWHWNGSNLRPSHIRPSTISATPAVPGCCGPPCASGSVPRLGRFVQWRPWRWTTGLSVGAADAGLAPGTVRLLIADDVGVGKRSRLA